LIRVVGIQNCELETFGAYAVTLSSMPEIELDIVHAYRGEELPAAEDCDFVLVGGTPISAWNASRHEFLALELDFLRELIVQQIPALGICCGAQMLAMLLGAEVSRAETMEVGAYSAQRADTGADDPALAGFPDEFPVYHWHGDTFGVPTGGTLLATGSGCRNQMFRVGPVVGVQFHLETEPDERAAWAAAYGADLEAAGTTAAAAVCEDPERQMERLELASRLITNLLESC